MSIPALEDWAKKGFQVVDQNGTTWKRIQLTTDGQVWQTWEAPFSEASVWAQEADTLMNQLAEEFPIKRVGLMFTAQDGSGGVLAQLPQSVMGRNKAAAEFSSQGASKALSEAMRSLAETMDQVLKTAREQLAAQSLRIESDQEEIRNLHELMRAQRELEAVEKEQTNAVSDILISQLKEAGPLAMQALELVMKKAAEKKATPAIAEAAAAATSNGATK